MKVLNLDIEFKPFGIGIDFKSFMFPSRCEKHIKLPEISSNKLLITTRIQSSDDIMLLLLATDAAKRLGVSEIELFIPYFPYARQDRQMINGEPLSVKVFSDLINLQGYSKVIIFDPHSDVTSALINNCEVINNHEFVKDAIHLFDSDRCKIISPDAGANKKIDSLCKYLGVDTFVRADKNRNIKTGEITGFEVYVDDLENKTCIIVDDICDGGGTFIGLAKELRKKNAGDLYLIVSHGIFSKGFDELKKHFKIIYTTNSFNSQSNEILTQINLRL